MGYTPLNIFYFIAVVMLGQLYLLSQCRVVTIDGVFGLDELDFLIPCTHHSELYVITSDKLCDDC